MKLIFVTVGNRVVNAVMSVIITNLNVRKCIITIDCFLGIRNVDFIWTFTRYVTNAVIFKKFCTMKQF